MRALALERVRVVLVLAIIGLVRVAFLIAVSRCLTLSGASVDAICGSH